MSSVLLLAVAVLQTVTVGRGAGEMLDSVELASADAPARTTTVCMLAMMEVAVEWVFTLVLWLVAVVLTADEGDATPVELASTVGSVDVMASGVMAETATDVNPADSEVEPGVTTDATVAEGVDDAEPFLSLSSAEEEGAAALADPGILSALVVVASAIANEASPAVVVVPAASADATAVGEVAFSRTVISMSDARAVLSRTVAGILSELILGSGRTTADGWRGRISTQQHGRMRRMEAYGLVPHLY